jgi:hypothetical protein
MLLPASFKNQGLLTELKKIALVSGFVLWNQHEIEVNCGKGGL